MTLTPSRLPKVRDQVASWLADPTITLRAAFPQFADEFDGLASQMPNAELYWATANMAALAVSSAEALPDVRWMPEDCPAPAGIMVFDGGVSGLDHGSPCPHRSRLGDALALADLDFGTQVHPVDAVTWGPSGDGLRLWAWVTRARTLAAWQAVDPGAAAVDTAPLVPLSGCHLPVSADPTAVADLDPQWRTIVTTVQAAWHLMDQPTLAERSSVPADKPVQRAYARAGKPAPAVTLVDLRRRYVPTDREPDDNPEGSRYRHRWVVRGHWTNQVYGKDRALRRRQWIADYLKGPDDAPLLATTRVNVWRR